MPRSLLIEGQGPCAFLWFKLLVTLDREERDKNQSTRKEEGGTPRREGSVFSGARTAETKRKRHLGPVVRPG